MRAVARAAWPWLAAGLLLLGLLAFSAFAPPPPPPQSPLTFSGNAPRTTSAFQLAGGYYDVNRQVTSGQSQDCLFEAEVLDLAGLPLFSTLGLDVPGATTVTWFTDQHYVPRGSYRLHVGAACGSWQLTISPQQQFDAEDTVLRVDGWQVNASDASAIVTNLLTDDESLQGWAVRLDGQSFPLPAAVALPAHASVTVHLAAGANSHTDLYLGAGSALPQALAQGPHLALINPAGTAVAQTQLPPASAPPASAGRLVNILGS